jgi:hypothetical protein
MSPPWGDSDNRWNLVLYDSTKVWAKLSKFPNIDSGFWVGFCEPRTGKTYRLDYNKIGPKNTDSILPTNTEYYRLNINKIGPKIVEDILVTIMTNYFFVPVLLHGSIFSNYYFLSTTLLTGTNGISLHVQLPLTTQSHDRTSFLFRCHRRDTNHQ